ncbi:MAG: hypothetical protein IKW54_05345 [Bacteroidales bacterium]|nr:hypothetical protein [Bacteroidales bacterium]
MANKEVAFCASCGAFVRSDNHTGDGRSLCNHCLHTVVSDVEQVKKLKRYVLSRFMEIGVLFDDKYLESVEIDIVSPYKMAEITHQSFNLNNKGITLSSSFNLIGTKLLGIKNKYKHHIYIISYMPKIEFAAVLAHEILHIWQIENGLQYTPQKCEGLCNIGSYLIYENMSAQRSCFYKKNLMESPDPIYGEGFRLLYKEYEKYGFEGLFEIARNNKL